jgi:two-component system sensor histidine kinase UhpB
MDSRPPDDDAGDMPAIVADRARPPGERQRASRTPTTALFWRLFGFNALVFVAGAAILVLSPATVSAPISLTELAVLTVGSVLMLVVNGALLRRTLRPLDGLTALMERVDLLRPGQRLSVSGDADVAHLIRTFNEMLDRLEHERGESSGHALAAQESERQRIARELHDEIGQSLTAVLLGLKRTIDRAPDELTDELHSVQEMVRSSLDEVRMVARRLRPGVLEDLGLPSALNALAADFTAASGIPVSPRLDQQLPELSNDAELVVYRIAQEGLTNIARHASAANVDLTVRHEAGSVVMTLIDDGLGTGDFPEGAGIRGMRERAILIGADLSLDSPTTGGTVLRLDVPIDAKGHTR